MRTWIAETSKKRRPEETGKRGNGERKEKKKGVSRFSASPLLRVSASSSLTPGAGFTLLELAVVLLIIGLLVMVAVPRLTDLTGARLESSARRLAALVRHLSGEAAFRSQVYRLHYDLDRRKYWVSVLTASQDVAEFLPDPSPLLQPVQLPTSIAFSDVRVPDVGRVSTGQVYTHFYPHGYTDPTVIHLHDQRSRAITVIIPPLTGEAEIYEGYVDTPAAR